MKKITYFLMLLLSVSAFSQVEIVEDFESIANNQVPSGWSYTNNFRTTSSFSCDGSAKSAYAGISVDGASATLTTANYVGISNGTNLTVSFSYNIFEQTSQFTPVSYSAPATGWGSLVLEYSTDGGTTWTNAVTINDSNYTFSNTTSCAATTNVSLGTIADGSDFQARFVLTRTTANGFALVGLVDNVSMTQVADSAPSCTALTSPVNGATDIDVDVTLNWAVATGLPTGYTISVGSSTGATDIVNAENTTGTSYALSGLDYETEYFVTIVPYKDIQELFRRMVFNLVYANSDDHLKNHSFIYNKQKDSWNLAPAYDLTYPFNVNLNYTNVSRALAINGKRADITIDDILGIADAFAVKNPKGILTEVQKGIEQWGDVTKELEIPQHVSDLIKKEFTHFI